MIEYADIVTFFVLGVKTARPPVLTAADVHFDVDTRAAGIYHLWNVKYMKEGVK